MYYGSSTTHFKAVFKFWSGKGGGGGGGGGGVWCGGGMLLPVSS